jgi:mannan endo-1,4-beta-mannosidase
MNHEYVITLEDMPGWNNYEIPITSIHPSTPQTSQRINLATLDFSTAKVYDMRGNRMSVNSFENLRGLPAGVYIVKTPAGRVLYTSK